MSLCARADVFIELSNGPVKRDIRSLLHWKQVLRTNAASSAMQLSAQVLCTSAALMREHVLPVFFAHIIMKRAQGALRMFTRIERCSEYL